MYESHRNRAPVVLIASQIVREELGFEFPQDKRRRRQPRHLGGRLPLARPEFGQYPLASHFEFQSGLRRTDTSRGPAQQAGAKNTLPV
jgi:hypothetical protein